MEATIVKTRADILREHGLDDELTPQSAEAPPQEEDWQSQLQISEKGYVLSNAFNTLWVMVHDEELKGKFAFNQMTKKVEIVGKTPWVRLNDTSSITDHDDSCLRNYLSIHYDIKSKDIIYDAINQIISKNQYHPVRDYLTSIQNKWDGKPRLERLFIDFMGAEDTELIRCQTRLTFVAAVKRVFQPGCKWDYVPVLKGGQGIGKSTFLQKIAINPEWFSDSLDDMRGKDAKAQLIGNWIIELGEMAAVGKGDQKRIKQFITSTEDEFRPAYGRRTVRHQRQSIFVATTNDEFPLKDDTGNRRWWIIDVYDKWFDKDFPLEIEQIWAEAINIYYDMEANNEPLKLPDYLENEATKIQIENTDRGIYAAEIEHVLQTGYIELNNTHSKTKVPINETCAVHVWERVLGRYRHDLNSAIAREINATLKNIEGWEYVGRIQFQEYGKQNVYRRMDT